VEKAALGRSMQMSSARQVLTIGLAPPEGAARLTPFSPVAPFPAQVLYWGSGYGQ